MVYISAEELDPYPGAFLKDNLEDKIARACTILADQYRAEGKESDAREALKNIEIARGEAAPRENAFRRLLDVKRLWERMMKFTAREEIRKRLREFLVSS